ncbi:MAG: hypothetical protein AAGE94_16220, partial [Acidobacteriota bacterium]
MRSSRLPGLLASSILLVLLATSVLAEPPSEPPTDPVLAGVVRMLDAELSEPVIRRWLATQTPPAAPSADDLIALRRAGASDDLLTALLDRALGVEVAPPVAPSPAPSAPPPPPAQTPNAPTATASTSEPMVEGSPVQATFRLSYRPYYLEDEEPWGLYAYLDGIPLTVVAESQPVGGRQILTFDKPLDPGRRMLRFVRERHSIREGEDDMHEARVIDAMLVFEVRPGAGDVQIEASFTQSPIRFADPMNVRVAQGGRTLDVQEDTGGNTDTAADQGNIRGRHADDSVASFVFVDGHAESLAYDSGGTDLQQANICLDKP